MARVIHEVQPRFVFVENSPMLTSRGLGRVLGDLAQMGFDAKWGVLGAADVGANHQRDRIWIFATDSNVPQQQRRGISCGIQKENAKFSNALWWKNQPTIHRMDDGVAARMDRLKAIGNGQVPLCATTAWRILSESSSN